MTLYKETKLASIELLPESGGLNVAWHTNIVENGEVISGPAIHRRAFAADELADIQPSIDLLVARFATLGVN
jgi:hypothetical protein